MPLGGLKWRDELEETEFKKVKSEVQILGIDDAPFKPGDKSVKIVAVLTRGAKMMDGVFHSSIKKDGLDATESIVQLVKDIKRENARAIILDGVTFGGFNTVDIQRVYKETGIPTIAAMDKRPDHAKINAALKNLEDCELRKKMIEAAGPIREIKVESGSVFIQKAGISDKDAEEIIKLATVNGLTPEPIRAAHMIAKGAYTEIPKQEEEQELPHEKVYNYVKDKHKEYKRLKVRYLPGIVGEIFDFLLAVAIAYVLIQGLGGLLNTSSPLVVVESESMIHNGDWTKWPNDHNLTPSSYGFGGGLSIGDIIVVKGDNPADIQVGDVVVYSKYGQGMIGGEPVIHRVVGIVDVNGQETEAYGIAKYYQNSTDLWAGKIVFPCTNRNSIYYLSAIKEIYSNEAIQKSFPGMNMEKFRFFITKGDNENNKEADQCLVEDSMGNVFPVISYPVHERLIIGRAKFDIPYLGYVKLGLVCAFNSVRGNVCGCRCWWPADHPKCCK